MLGQVTSSYFSPTLNHSIAMALIKEGNRKIGSQIYVSTSNMNVIPVEVVKPNFLDPENKSCYHDKELFQEMEFILLKETFNKFF